MSTNNFKNPLARSFNPLSGGDVGVTINQKTIGNQLHIAMPQVEQIKLEEKLLVPKEFLNVYIEWLCQSEMIKEDLNKFETIKIKIRNKSI
jgi:hypothetical protein